MERRSLPTLLMGCQGFCNFVRGSVGRPMDVRRHRSAVRRTRPPDVRRTFVGRPMDVRRPTHVRRTSPGRPSEVCRTSAGRPLDVRRTSVDRTSDGRPTDVGWTSAGRPWIIIITARCNYSDLPLNL